MIKPTLTVIKSKPFSLSKFVHNTVFDNAIDFVEHNMTLATTGMNFIEQPVSFRTFVESKEHMDFPRLSDRQHSVVDFMIGDDMEKVFTNLNSLAILSWGKGSGKDALCVLLLCYVCYILLCMESPQRYFKMPEGEYIDSVNIAPSGDKANTIFFEKLRQRILRWRWLKNKYPLRSSGAFVSQIRPQPGQPFTSLTKDGIIFPKLIRLLSRNSDNESAEGLNTLVYILDEASAFRMKGTTRNASKIYKVVRSSSITRFGLQGKGFIISYPREKKDFTMQMYHANLGNLHVYTDQGATWDIKPKHLFSGKWWEWEGHKIPLEFKSEFETDPTGSKMMYMADPPESEHGFIEYPEKITECVNPQAVPVVREEDHIKDGKVCKRITGFNTNRLSIHDYIVTVDLGQKSDTAALSMFHREVIGDKPIFVQDMVTGWKPDRKNKYLVSFESVQDYIKMLASKFNIIGVWFDQWQSISLRESLNNAAIPSHEYNLDKSDYMVFKELLYTKRYRFLPFAPQFEEMKRLIATTTRIDHPTTGSKDYVDTIVGATKVFLLKHQSTGQDEEWGDVETISENLHMVDPWA